MEFGLRTEFGVGGPRLPLTTKHQRAGGSSNFVRPPPRADRERAGLRGLRAEARVASRATARRTAASTARHARERSAAEDLDKQRDAHELDAMLRRFAQDQWQQNARQQQQAQERVQQPGRERPSCRKKQTPWDLQPPSGARHCTAAAGAGAGASTSDAHLTDAARAHEHRWRRLCAAPPASIGVNDIPWPTWLLDDAGNAVALTTAGRTPTQYLCAVLGWRAAATGARAGALKAALRARMLRWHPDKFEQQWGTRLQCDAGERCRVLERARGVMQRLVEAKGVWEEAEHVAAQKYI